MSLLDIRKKERKKETDLNSNQAVIRRTLSLEIISQNEKKHYTRFA